MTRLSPVVLDRLPLSVARPCYDRSAVRRGVVHLGIGAFHRAHQAVIFDDVMGRGDMRWGITAASMRSPTVSDQLMPQDGLYTLVVRDGADERHRIIGAVQDVLLATRDHSALLTALASPDTHIVTLTITEKGYMLDPATGALMGDDPRVAADVASLSAPQTAIGFLVAALAMRRESGLPPFTAISCDNLPHNGALLRKAVLHLAERHDAALAAWIAEHGAFPQTMVDRIVPATTHDDIAALADFLTVEDQAMVKTEPFIQWVIEDKFCGPRPDFGAGVQITKAVAPWEEAKLRLLNGAHSGIAYLGGLAGVDHVHDMMMIPSARAFVERLWDETQTTLNPPPELDIDAYRRALMARFDNAALMHRTRQIAMDGSQKLPQRLLAPIMIRRKRGQAVDALSLAVAGWIHWQNGRDDHGERYDVDDPMAGQIGQLMETAPDSAGRVDAILGLSAIFPPTLRDDAVFRAAVTRWLVTLEHRGALAALDALKQDG